VPELPDVETFRRDLDAATLRRRIASASVRDPRLLGNVSADTLRRRLRGRRVAATRRHGKHLLVELDRGGCLVLHFGMTGGLRAIAGEDELGAHDRVVLWLAGDGGVAVSSVRLFGEVSLADSAEALIRDRRLGPDALTLDERGLADALRGNRAGIKSALMNQQRIAGIGNVYSDEILFQARLHPAIIAADLSAAERRRLHRAVGAVLRQAIEVRADPARMPPEWITPRRHAGAPCPVCGGEIERRSVGGRSAYFCRRCQKR
jgi:formamidopyrimidine-DNA glycosylase